MFIIMKRARECEESAPNKRPYATHVYHKRKRIATFEPNKRMRSNESDALHRMLVEAYARIEQLEQQLKQSKFLQEHYLRSMSNSMYNHGIMVH